MFDHPDYDRASEIVAALKQGPPVATRNRLIQELYGLLDGPRAKPVEGMVCHVPGCQILANRSAYRTHPVYYPGRVHHVDGNPANNVAHNMAMVCPHCHTHILLARNTPDDVWDLRLRGLNNAHIGRLLGISRERVRQLLAQGNPLRRTELPSEEQLDHLIEEAQKIERAILKHEGAARRVTDRRTLRKRILAKLATGPKRRKKHNEGTHQEAEQG